MNDSLRNTKENAATTNQTYPASSLWQKFSYNNQYSNYIRNLTIFYRSNFYLILSLVTIFLVSIVLFSIVIVLSLIPVFINLRQSPVSGSVFLSLKSPIKKITCYDNFFSSVSSVGLTIWDTQRARNFTFISHDQIDFLDQLNSTTVVTLSKNGNLSYWNGFGFLKKSILLDKQVYTAMKTTKSGRIIMGSQNGTIIFLNSNQKLVKKIHTDSSIVDMTIMLNDDLATVDSSQNIKIYNSRDYSLGKIFNFSDHNGKISILSIGFIKNIEHLIFSIGSRLFLFDFINENLVRIINAPGDIVELKYVKNGLVVLAIGQYLYYYDLLTGFHINSVAMHRNIKSLNTNGSHLYVGTKSGEIAVLKTANNFVKTILRNEKFDKIYIAMNNRSLLISDSFGAVEQSLVTAGKTSSMSLLSNKNLVTLDLNNEIRIWEYRTFKLIKAISGLNKTGPIEKIDTCFISNLECILYTTGSILFVLDYSNEKVLGQINALGKISNIQCIKNDHVVLAVGNILFYYDLKDGTSVENVTLSNDILDLYPHHADLRVTLLDGKIFYFSLAKYNQKTPEKNIKSLKSVMVQKGVIIPIPNGKVIMVEKQTANIIIEKTLFKSEMIAFERLNESVICALSENGEMVLINTSVDIIKKIKINKKNLNENIENIIIIDNKFILIKCLSKIIQVFIGSGKVNLFKIN